MITKFVNNDIKMFHDCIAILDKIINDLKTGQSKLFEEKDNEKLQFEIATQLLNKLMQQNSLNEILQSNQISDLAGEKLRLRRDHEAIRDFIVRFVIDVRGTAIELRENAPITIRADFEGYADKLEEAVGPLDGTDDNSIRENLQKLVRILKEMTKTYEMPWGKLMD